MFSPNDPLQIREIGERRRFSWSIWSLGFASGVVATIIALALVAAFHL